MRKRTFSESKRMAIVPKRDGSQSAEEIWRSQYEEASFANRKRILRYWDMYKRRQAIVGHPLGTVTQSWGFNYTLLKSKKKVSAELVQVWRRA